MANVTATIPEELAAWLTAQPVFFVATAPLSADGHINLSPKGLDTFRVLDPHTVAWLDLTGSGAETIAHFRENGRATLMFCAFDGPPRIIRLQGRGDVVLPASPEFATLIDRFPTLSGTRSILRVRLSRVAKTCGFAVPRMEFIGTRDRLQSWADEKGPEGVADYQEKNNRLSIDGLPALSFPS